ncbi:MAG: AbrB/MazE/SpoVT family DNA-binding domain-containing protein [Anaerolineae bacterium]
MKELLTVVTRKGQITLPAEIRQRLGIKEGDKIAVSVDEAEPTQAIVRPVRSVAEMTYGAVAPLKRPEDFIALREAFENETAEDAEAETH